MIFEFLLVLKWFTFKFLTFSNWSNTEPHWKSMGDLGPLFKYLYYYYYDYLFIFFTVDLSQGHDIQILVRSCFGLRSRFYQVQVRLQFLISKVRLSFLFLPCGEINYVYVTASSRDKSTLVHGNNHGNVISTKAGFCVQRFNNQSQLAMIFPA